MRFSQAHSSVQGESGGSPRGQSPGPGQAGMEGVLRGLWGDKCLGEVQRRF